MLLLADFSLAHADMTGDWVITNARLIDGSGSGPQHNANIYISRGRIAKVGYDNLDEAKGVKIVDAGGKTVVPGLSDVHTHITLRLAGDDFDWGNIPEEIIPSSQRDLQEYVTNELPEKLRQYLEIGVTNIVDVGAYWPLILDIRERIQNAELLSPRLFVAGPIFTAPGGHPASTLCNNVNWCVENLTVSTDDPQYAQAKVRELAATGADGVKLVYDDSSLWSTRGIKFPQMKKEVMEAVIDEAHRVGLPVVAHVEVTSLAVESILAGIDTLAHAPMDDPETGNSFTFSDGSLPTLLNQFGVSVVMTALEEEARGRFKLVAPSIKQYKEAGVELLFASDYTPIGVEDPGPALWVAEELRVLQQAGVDNLEIINMMTGNAALHAMTPGDIGSIRPGNLADVLILQGDPLDDLSAILKPEVVIKAGEVVIDNRK